MSSIAEMIKENEKIFNGALPIKYYFSPSTEVSEHLIIGFSGFNGKESTGEPARYNYVKQLRDFNCHKLFILDSYDGHPCYYIGKNKSLDYEVTVMALINYIANRLQIPMSNVITIGSSKGGTAALYFGMKYSLGHVVAGGMQTKVGDYLWLGDYTRNKVLPLITNGNEENDRRYLNRFFEKIFFNPRKNTNYNIHGGAGDHHFVNYGKPFIECLDNHRIKYRLDIQDYSDHGLIGQYYTPFLMNQLSRITGKITILRAQLEQKENELKVFCHIANTLKSDSSIRYAYYFFRNNDNEPFEKIHYNRANSYTLTVSQPGKYRVRIYIRNEKGIVKIGTNQVEV
ncbi:hypothetical protein [Neobacillus kokaensis]|uniref:Two component regulator three Y domain-containing protein n=1 Tax=Neobacillus kokaensis TaxID=2759023 RepID=A0ABQ3MXP5_9BACI|nr:hypothetical protein [Neobacillus kokaensis]GHH97448.1 hypothetical protein AM1BK_09910 [Neobacillus kokaensis]